MTFFFISVVIFNLVAILIPKRMTPQEIYSTILFALVLDFTVDIVLNLKYDFYGYFNKGVDFMGFVLVFGLYPAGSTIILNYFPFTKGIKAKVVYILAWSAFLVLFEWAFDKAGYFYHHQWRLWHSALAYPIILLILAWNLSFIRSINRKKYID